MYETRTLTLTISIPREGLSQSKRTFHTRINRLFQRLYKIVRRDTQLIRDAKGPSTLNKVGRKFEMKRILKNNEQMLQSIKKAKPSVSISDLKRRFDDTERYKSIASTYNINGKKEDPVELKMREFYYNIPASPSKRSISKTETKSKFSFKVKRYNSIDARSESELGSNPYKNPNIYNDNFTEKISKSRELNNKSTILPRLSDSKGIITSSQYNKMLSTEMSKIRLMKRGHKTGFSSINKIFHKLDLTYN